MVEVASSGRLRLRQFFPDQRSKKLCCLVTDNVVARKVGVTIPKPSWKMAEMGVKAVVENLNRRLCSGNDERLHKLSPILRDLFPDHSVHNE